MTEWRDIAGWEDQYKVSDDGLIHRKILTYRNKYNPVVLKRATHAGYLQVWLGGQSGRNHYVHRLVAFAFIGPPPSDRHEIAHGDGSKTNNHWTNLRWATRGENTADKRLHNAHPKLTQVKVDEIRRRANEKPSDLAKEFGVVHSHILRVIRREQWA